MDLIDKQWAIVESLLSNPVKRADGTGFPFAISAGSASPYEVKLVEKTLHDRLIRDQAYDSDPLDEKSVEQDIL